ncbi:hypothetical protein BCR32DRAFT_270911 [Anaeromyces robustus]|uniref:Uncharacterized protein n=1 Tax=Anaeromyces robustus TaxID=1754192 RepID=A0A1Y1WUR8_9FUNG|nr:hypothetical protein BCR32DRAFT_270911 [Anaeromyces robustus]|eukprot:ORX77038.1 hypothetical protein BCR32DRAFT_270911 [Anaeromyces robustus]
MEGMLCHRENLGYLLSYVLNFYGNSIYICREASTITNIPTCSSILNTIFNVITAVSVVVLLVVCFLYNTFYFDVNCLSKDRYCSTIYKAENNEILLAKFFLAFQQTLLPSLLDSNENIDKTLIRNLCIFFIGLIFLYISFAQLKSQPYYSETVNNYKFAVYFSIGVYSLFTFIMCILKINTNAIVGNLFILLYVVLFIGGYFLNSIYKNHLLKNIYKKFHEKESIKHLRESVSEDELKYGSEKLVKKNFYNSVERITNEVFIKKEIKVFNNYYECDIACRFLRKNRDIEAYNLMKSLFEEGISQFKHEANVYLIAWYYMHSMKVFYKNNNLIKKYDMELFNGDNVLSNSMDLKLDMRKKYLINKAESLTELEKKESSMNRTSNEVSSTLKLEELKNTAVMTHIEALKEIKTLFTKLRSSTNIKDILTYNTYVSNICKYQNSAYSQYNSIIREFPDEKETIKMYILFLTDVMGKEDVAYHYSNIFGTDKNDTVEKDDSSKIVKLKKKPINSSSNSLTSVPHSEDYSVASGLGKDIRKKLNSKNSMAKKFITPIKNFKLKMNLCIVLFIAIFAAQAVYIISVFNFGKNQTLNLNVNIHIPGTIKDAAVNSRILSLSLILNDSEVYAKYSEGLSGDIYILRDMCLVSVSETMSEEIVKKPLIVPVGNYAYDSYEKWLNEDEDIFDILFDPHFRYFMVNAKSGFDNSFADAKHILGDSILERFQVMEYLVIGSELLLCVIALMILYITYGPLKQATNKITYNAFRMYKYISKDSFEEVLTNYEEKIEGLCENYEVDKEVTDNRVKNDKSKSIRNIKLIISFIVIFIFIALGGIPALESIVDIRKLLKIINKSSDRYSLLKGIQLFTYEVLNQDRSLFLPEEPERILRDYIVRLEDIQEELKSGSYGGPTFDSYPELDFITKEKGCHRMYYDPSCDFMFYDPSYGYSEEVATLPINELIREYLYHVKMFLLDIEKGTKYQRVPFTSRENLRILFDQEINADFFRLQDGLMSNIIGDIQVVDSTLIENSITILDKNTNLAIYIMAIGSVVLIGIGYFIFNKMYDERVKQMESLVSFLFLMPQSVVNKNEKFKRFLETTQTDE